jgi:hypothetical protein
MPDLRHESDVASYFGQGTQAGTVNSGQRAIGPEDVPRDPPQIWPDWPVTDIRLLAQYVSSAGLDDLSIRTPAPYSRTGWSRGNETASAVYEAIRALELRYSFEAFRPGGGGPQGETLQRVRYPARMTRDSCGTCLDFALLYAAALMRAQIRPLIAISACGITEGDDEGAVQPGQGSHAFVIADLRAPLQDSIPDFPRPFQGVKAGVLRLDPDAGSLPGQFVAIDPTVAATGRAEAADSGDYLAAVHSGEELIRTWAKTGIVFCDVMALQSTVLGRPLGRPADDETPAIWTRLPEMPAATSYSSRECLRDDVMSAHGYIVIHGPQGFGKSTLAYERARLADSGYGWFLNAADPAALQSELARAEIEQQARTLGALDKLDRMPFSQAAVRRLEISDAPWVLVLDNANGDPGSLLPLLPRAPKANQTIIVTTTREEWKAVWPGAVFKTLSELTDIDMGGVPDEVRPRLGGSPLFYEAALLATGAGAELPAGAGSNATLIEQLALQVLGDSSVAARLAYLVAWAPPVPLPLLAFDGLCGGSALEAGRQLAEVGLVRVLARPEPAVLMHRLVAAQVRSTPRLVPGQAGRRLQVPVALMASAGGQELLITRGDAETFQRLELFLDKPAPVGVTTRPWGVAEYGVARAGELVGRSEQSARLFERAIGYLDALTDASLISECWNGRARHVKDHPPGGAVEKAQGLAEALGWAERAEQIAREADKRVPDLWDVVRAERARAMQALVMKAQAKGLARSERKSKLAEALHMLEKSEAARVAILDQLKVGDSPDRDRARFNLGGVCIELAQMCSGAEADEYLRLAREVYETVKQMRVRRHGEGVALPSIAACDNGLALALYYGALLSADPLRDPKAPYAAISLQSRLALLRQATASAWDALRDRTALSAAEIDDPNALKSDDLMIKILEARKILTAVAKSNGVSLAADTVDAVLGAAEREARSEARSLGGLLAVDTSAAIS